MKKILILGGGLAGLSTAVFLSQKNFDISIIESSPKLGGRTYSYFDRSLNLKVDNGQHLMLGCYSNTLEFISIIKSRENLKSSNGLNIQFIKDKKTYHLNTEKFFFPLNYFYGILKFKLITSKDKLRFAKLIFSDIPIPSNISALDVISRRKFSNESIETFWTLIAKSLFNADLKNISGELFLITLKTIFKGSKSSKMLLPKSNYDELLIEPARKFLVERGIAFYTSETVTAINTDYNEVTSLVTNKNVYDDFDYIVSAIPFHEIKELLEINCDFKPSFSPIISVHVKLKKNNCKQQLYGLINSPFDWVFNNGSHLTIVVSNADELVLMDNEYICKLAAAELNTKLKIKPEDIEGLKVIKEKFATYIVDENFRKNRPSYSIGYNNIFLAGDYTETGLPCTIEGAIKSGVTISKALGDIATS